MVEAVMVIVACCAGLGLTLSYFTFGSHRFPHHNNNNNNNNKQVTPTDGNSSEGQGVGRGVDSKQRVLVVTAHPDDEVMFFGPTILHYTQHANTTLYLLCLSNGNYYGDGGVRSQELLSSCSMLGVARENVLQYRCDQLPDHPSVSWPTPTTASLINHYIHALDIDVVITFDRWGVSGHINHIATHTALQHLMEQRLLPQGCEVYQLESVSVLRKYLSFLDVPLTYVLSTCVFTLNTKQWSILQRAMRQHKSQMLWFRYIYSYFSRYLLINTLAPITHKH